MNQEQRDSLWGPEARFSEHKRGDSITFTEDDQEKTGVILHVMAPGTTVDGTPHGILYVVEAKQKGFPSMVAPGDVIG